MEKSLRVDIVAPDHRVFQGEAVRLRVPGIQGAFEIRYNHAPMIAAMDIGQLSMMLDGEQQLTFATSGGFVEVIGNVVTILAETIEPATDIDIERANASEKRARRRLSEARDSIDRARAEAALERARNRTRVAVGRVGQRRS